MSDFVSNAQRSKIMSKVPQRDSKQEILVRKYLFSEGFRFRKNDKRLPGSPDIVLPKYKIVIFVHGCFWHGHVDCKYSRLPTTRHEFWKKKIETNIERDKHKNSQLESLGWKVITIWQCQIKNRDLERLRLERLIEEILSFGPQ